MWVYGGIGGLSLGFLCLLKVVFFSGNVDSYRDKSEI